MAQEIFDYRQVSEPGRKWLLKFYLSMDKFISFKSRGGTLGGRQAVFEEGQIQIQDEPGD